MIKSKRSPTYLLEAFHLRSVRDGKEMLSAPWIVATNEPLFEAETETPWSFQFSLETPDGAMTSTEVVPFRSPVCHWH